MKGRYQQFSTPFVPFPDTGESWHRELAVARSNTQFINSFSIHVVAMHDKNRAAKDGVGRNQILQTQRRITYDSSDS